MQSLDHFSPQLNSHGTLEEQIETAKQEIAASDATLAVSDNTLRSLCQQAACEKQEDLVTVAQQATERDRLVQDLKSVEDELLEAGDGHTIEALELEVREIDRDTLNAELDLVVNEIEGELHPERERLIEEKINAERAFGAMTGGDEAAMLAAEAQQITVEIRLLSENYVRTKLAGRVLRDQIEQFRQAHRDPILTRGSGYLQRLTCGAFTEIKTTLDETDQPILIAVRSNEQRLRVEGMSTGTRDQLYLALRLATLDHYLETSEPLPFIVDDILIQFDDERSSATLDTLADFSQRTQVILFTHHRQVVEQARIIPTQQNGVIVHELSSAL